MRTIALLLLLLSGACGGLSAQYTCNNIANFDFGNAILTMGGIGLTTSQEYGDVNFPAVKEQFAFRKGVAVQWEDAEEHDAQKPDFRITIDHDQLLHPDGSPGVKLLSVEMDHLTGSGSFQYVTAYDCRGHRLHKLLDVSGEGVIFRSANDYSIKLTLFLSSEADLHCCPSKNVDVTFEWSPTSQAYIGPKQGTIRPNK
jgi:hypothetical protein